MTRRAPAALVLAALASAVAGCGGGADPPPAPADVVVPDVSGMTPGAAGKTLCAARLDPDVRIVHTPAVRPMRAALAAPRVRGTTPPAGSSVGHGGVVTMTVAVPANVSLVLREGC